MFTRETFALCMGRYLAEKRAERLAAELAEKRRASPETQGSRLIQRLARDQDQDQDQEPEFSERDLAAAEHFMRSHPGCEWEEAHAHAVSRRRR
jgi:Zn-dependent protease with chaperone function